jgi:hypothetical protein
MASASARRPDSLPSPALLRRRCEALARLDAALDPDAEVPTHDFDRRAGVFWLRESEGNHLQISFTRRGVVILGFDHESPMSPVHNDEETWPGVVDHLPPALRPVLRAYPYGVDVTFCIWRLAGARRWQSGRVRRPRGRDADGSQRLLGFLTGPPHLYRRFARFVYEIDVPLAVIEGAYAGGPVDRRRFSKSPPPVPKKPAKRQKKPRFRIGDRIIDPWGSRGKITRIWNGLDAAAAAGALSDVTGWLRGLSIRPKTPRRGIWYSVRPSSGGSRIVGELDLRRAARR